MPSPTLKLLLGFLKRLLQAPTPFAKTFNALLPAYPPYAKSSHQRQTTHYDQAPYAEQISYAQGPPNGRAYHAYARAPAYYFPPYLQLYPQALTLAPIRTILPPNLNHLPSRPVQ